MIPITRSQTGVGQSSPAPVDYFQNPVNVGIGVVVSGTVTYSIEQTFDDYTNAAVTPTWTAVDANLTAKTANAFELLPFPVRGLRVNVTAGTGTATMTIIQAG